MGNALSSLTQPLSDAWIDSNQRRVGEWLDDATADSVLQALTRQFYEGRETLTALRGAGSKAHVKEVFDRYGSVDEVDGARYWNEKTLEEHLASRFPGSEAVGTSIPILWRCFLWHAYFPFPEKSSSHRIDYSAFQRAVALLAAGGGSRLGDDANGAAWDLGRDRDGDARWRMFRSLAVRSRHTTGIQAADSIREDLLDVLALVQPVHPAMMTVQREELQPRADKMIGPSEPWVYTSIPCKEFLELLKLLLTMEVDKPKAGACFNTAHTGPANPDPDVLDGLAKSLLGSFTTDEGSDIDWQTFESVLSLSLPNLLSQFRLIFTTFLDSSPLPPGKASAPSPPSSILSNAHAQYLSFLLPPASNSSQAADLEQTEAHLCLQNTEVVYAAPTGTLSARDLAAALDPVRAQTLVLISDDRTAVTGSPARVTFGAYLPATPWGVQGQHGPKERFAPLLFQLEPRCVVLRSDAEASTVDPITIGTEGAKGGLRFGAEGETGLQVDFDAGTARMRSMPAAEKEERGSGGYCMVGAGGGGWESSMRIGKLEMHRLGAPVAGPTATQMDREELSKRIEGFGGSPLAESAVLARLAAHSSPLTAPACSRDVQPFLDQSTSWRVRIPRLVLRAAGADPLPVPTQRAGSHPQASSPVRLPRPSLLVPQDPKRRTGSEEKGTPAEDRLRSRSPSVWTAPSPSRIHRPRSRDPSRPSLETTPTQKTRSENGTSFYTALWGSPYDLPPSSFAREGRFRYRGGRAGTLSEDTSPLRASRRNGLRVPRADPAERSSAGSSTSPRTERRGFDDAPLTDPGPDHFWEGRTEDWLETHIAFRRKGERRNWWSDESEGSGGEASSGGRTGRQRGSEHAWLDFDSESSGSDASETDYSAHTGSSGLRPAYHGAHLSDVTLRQEDFDDLCLDGFEPSSPTSVMIAALRQSVVPVGSTSLSEKPLPPPLSSRAASLSPAPSSTRPKKRVNWKNKTCTIALPSEVTRDESGAPKVYLTPSDVSARLAEWRRKGVSTRGFDLSGSSESDLLGHSQSRDIYPDSGLFLSDSQYGNYRVSIPDKGAWDDYVRGLQEVKLRALGVSLGDDRPPSISPGPSSEDSRVPSAQPIGLPSSANGLCQGPDSILSPPLTSSADPFDPRQSTVAPAPERQSIPSFHLSTPSTSLGSNFQHPGALSPFQYAQPTPPSPENWVQQQRTGSRPGSRSVSPARGGQQAHGFGGGQSPASPASSFGADGYFPAQRKQPRAQSRPRQDTLQHAQNAIIQNQHIQHQARPSIVSAPSDHQAYREAQPVRYVSQPEIASPVPRGHRQNLSAALQKEIDAAEYHLEETIRKQLEDDEKNPLPAEPLVSHSQRPSASTLGVNVAEAGRPSAQSSAPPSMPPGPQNAWTNFTFGKNVGAAAPAFAPDRFQVPAVAQLEFSFSSSIPGPKPAAPSFAPRTSSLVVQAVRGPSGSDEPAQKIFGSYNVSETLKSARRPRATIPGARPRDSLLSSGSESEAQEDESGRITAADGRRKRQRNFTRDDGDSVPLFATPSRDTAEPSPGAIGPGMMPTPSISVTPSGGAMTPREMASEPDRGAIVAPEQAASSLKGTSKAKNRLSISPVTLWQGVRSAFGSNSKKSGKSGKPGLDALAEPGMQSSADEKAGQFTPLPSPVEEAAAVREVKRSPLSATAKPFEFTPTATGFVPAEEAVSALPGGSSNGMQPAAGPSQRASSSTRPGAPIRSRTTDDSSFIDPTFTEIDEVIRQLNGDDSDIGVERRPVPKSYHNAAIRSRAQSKIRSRAQSKIRSSPAPNPGARGRSQLRSRDPSPAGRAQPAPEGQRGRRGASLLAYNASPKPPHQPYHYLPSQRGDRSLESAVAELVARNNSPSYRPSRHSSSRHVPAQKSNRAGDAEVSDWDDMLSEVDEKKLRARKGFFDNKVDDIVGNIVEQRLRPLEQTLALINTSLARISSRSRSRRHRRDTSGEVEDSDADDEDDGRLAPARALSPMKDRRYERLKASVLEMISTQRPAGVSEDLAAITSSLVELKASVQGVAAKTAAAARPTEDLDKITESLTEIKSSLREQQARPTAAPAADNSAAIMELLSKLGATVQEQQSKPAADMKAIVEEVINRHMRGKSVPVMSSREAAATEKLQLHIDGLESMLKVAEARASDELRARAEAEEALRAQQKLLQDARAEAAAHRDAAEETEESLRSFVDKQQEYQRRLKTFEEEGDMMRSMAQSLSAKNDALEGTLEEYRLSHADQKREIEDARSKAEESNRTVLGLRKNLEEACMETRGLDRIIVSLKEELEHGIRGKLATKNKFERLQQDMAEAIRNIARDQASWRNREEEHKARHDLLGARLEAEARTRERLEIEIDRLERQEKEAMKSRFMVEQIRAENINLGSLVNELRAKGHEYQDRAVASNRELHDVKARAEMEMQRIRKAANLDIDAATQRVQIVRDDLEAAVERLETQLESVKEDAANARDRHHMLLEEASDSKNTALREAADSRGAALQEHYRFHERTLDESKATHDASLAKTVEGHKQAMDEARALHERDLARTAAEHKRVLDDAVASYERVLADAREDHRRGLDEALGSKRMTENYLNGRLDLADEKVVHFQDRIAHLEERLELAKSAAQAAALAAQSARKDPATRSDRAVPSMPRGSEAPISPQALRESILVLQEQLHEREGQIEGLQQDLAKADDGDAPAKIKEKDMEISWLRELLGVRLDDLSDIIKTLSSPSYDRNAARDAAIRLRANLQMEQQEKERAMAGAPSSSFPSIASITQNIAASPRAIPLAAAAAWGNWRKGQSSLGSVAEAANGGNPGASQTPSRTASAHSFLSGLLTPPSTSLRQAPSRSQGTAPTTPKAAAARHRPLEAFSTPKRKQEGQDGGEQQQQQQQMAAGELTQPPDTPSLLRKASYDQDAAEGGHYSLDRYVAEGEDEDESAMGGEDERGMMADDGLFGPTVRT